MGSGFANLSNPVEKMRKNKSLRFADSYLRKTCRHRLAHTPTFSGSGKRRKSILSSVRFCPQRHKNSMTDVQKRPKQKDAGILDSPEKNSSMLKHCQTRLFCSKLSIRSTYIIAHLSKKGNGNRWRSAGIFAALRDQAGTEKPSNLPEPVESSEFTTPFRQADMQDGAPPPFQRIAVRSIFVKAKNDKNTRQTVFNSAGVLIMNVWYTIRGSNPGHPD